jgi:hypothetical protein
MAKRRPTQPLVVELLETIQHAPQSVRQLDAVSGVSRNTIYRWKMGQSAPSLFVFETVVNALGGRLKIEWDHTIHPGD